MTSDEAVIPCGVDDVDFSSYNHGCDIKTASSYGHFDTLSRGEEPTVPVIVWNTSEQAFLLIVISFLVYHYLTKCKCDIKVSQLMTLPVNINN